MSTLLLTVSTGSGHDVLPQEHVFHRLGMTHNLGLLI